MRPVAASSSGGGGDRSALDGSIAASRRLVAGSACVITSHMGLGVADGGAKPARTGSVMIVSPMVTSAVSGAARAGTDGEDAIARQANRTDRAWRKAIVEWKGTTDGGSGP